MKLDVKQSNKQVTDINVTPCIFGKYQKKHKKRVSVILVLQSLSRQLGNLFLELEVRFRLIESKKYFSFIISNKI